MYQAKKHAKGYSAAVMALPSFLNQTCWFLLHGNAGCAEGTADTAIQGAVSHDSAGSLLADQAVGPSGIKQTATAASVCTAELGKLPQCYRDADSCKPQATCAFWGFR